MITYTTPNTLFQQKWVQKLSDGSKVCMTLPLLFFFFFVNVFNSITQAQSVCPYNVTLVTGYPSYNATTNQTTFVWSVTNPNPGNGENGTVQGLSWWGFAPNACTPDTRLDDEDIVKIGYGSSSNPATHTSLHADIKEDKSCSNTGSTSPGQPILKFDAGTSDESSTYYSLVLEGRWGTGTMSFYYKSGVRTGCGSCTIAGVGVGCELPACPAVTFTGLPTAAICPGTVVDLNASVSGGTFAANVSGLINATTGVFTAPSVTTQTTYTITYTLPGCPATPVGTITVKPCPPQPSCPTVTVTGAPNTNICPGTVVTLVPSVTGGTFSANVSGVITTGGVFTAPSVMTATTYTISYTLPGCPAGTVATITVAPCAPPPGTCPYNITLVSSTYANGQTTFVWSVVNPNPGNGSNNTVQDLSWWGFVPNANCAAGMGLDESDIVSAGFGATAAAAIANTSLETDINTDKSQDCTGNTAIFKFDRGTSGSTATYYSLVLNGSWTTATMTAYYKSGVNTGCGTCTFTGVGCMQPACPTITPTISANPAQFFTNRTIVLSATIAGGTGPYTYSWSTSTAGVTLSSTTSATPTATFAAGVNAATFNLTVKDANNCTGTATFNFGLEQICPLITTPTIPPPSSICPGANTGSITVSNAQIGVTYTLLQGTTTVATQTATAGTVTFSGLAAGTYTVRASYLTCGMVTSQPVTIGTITVEAPTAPTTPITRCGAGTVTLTANGCTNGTLRWYTTATGGTPLTSTTVTVTQSTTYYVSCVVNGCESARTAVPVVVVPSPNTSNLVLSVASGAICQGGGGSVQLTLSGSQVGVYYQLLLNNAAVGAPVAGTGGPISFAPQSAAGTYSVLAYYTTVVDNVCVISCPVTIPGTTVEPIPLPQPPTPSTTPITICAPGGSVTLTATGCTGGTLVWYTAQTGGTAIGTGTPTVNVTATTSYWVACRVGACESARTEIVVTVNPLPTVTASNAAVCVGGTVQLTGTPAGGTWSGGAYVNSSGMFSAVGLAAGTYNVTYSYTNANNCTATATAVVTVVASPQAPTPTTVSTCPGVNNGSITFASQTGVTYVLSLSGTPVQTMTGTGANITFGSLAAGSYVITASNTAAPACPVTFNATVTALAKAPCVPITGPTSVCMGTTNTYSIQATSCVTNYQWSITGPCVVIGTTNSSTVNIKAVGSGTFTVNVTLTYTDGSTSNCSGLTVTSTPLAVTATPVTVCPGQTSVSLAGHGTPTGGTWASPDPLVNSKINNAAQTIDATGIPAGTYTLTYVVTQSNGCTGSAITYLSVLNQSVIGGLAGRVVAIGSTGMEVTMNKSARGIKYQLLRNGVKVGTPVEGTGSAISFGTQDINGDYSVTASTQSGDCSTTGAAGRIDPSGAPARAQAGNLNVTAFPNPFNDRIRFTIKSDYSGQGVLEVYNVLGAKIKTVYEGYINAGRSQDVDFYVPGAQRVNMVYKLRVGNHETSGKLINIK